jgi:1-acyl-sn-glycerol-3-phosphate acyltransferase
MADQDFFQFFPDLVWRHLFRSINKCRSIDIYPMAQPQFYPPKRNFLLIRLVQMLFPWAAKWILQMELVISSESLGRLRGLQEKPYLILCNHPTFHDPMVMFLLSGRLKVPFYYLAAYEQFQGKFQGWLYQSMGAYSIRRGLADRPSIAQTIDLMQERDCHLVIFPEGGCSFQNDTVMPLRAGGVQMALQAMGKRAKSGKVLRDFYVVPVSLKYRYRGDMTGAIEAAFTKLEQALKIQPTGDFYQRLRIIAAQLIERFEQEYGLSSSPDADWGKRISALKSEVLQQCEFRLGLTSAAAEPDRERVYRIRHALSNRQNTLLPDGTDGWDVIGRASMRMLNFDAIYDGYVAANPTPERFLDTLIRFEREVFEIDQPEPKGYRYAYLEVGEPVNLKDHFPHYVKDRSRTTDYLLNQLQQTMQKNLDQLAK